MLQWPQNSVRCDLCWPPRTKRSYWRRTQTLLPIHLRRLSAVRHVQRFQTRPHTFIGKFPAKRQFDSFTILHEVTDVAYKALLRSMLEHQKCPILSMWDMAPVMKCTCEDGRKLLCRHVTGYLLKKGMIGWPRNKDPRPLTTSKTRAPVAAPGTSLST